MQVLLYRLRQRILFAALSLFAAALTNLPARGDDFEFFEKKIRPLLAEHCYKCHSVESEKLKSGFLLDSKEGMLNGGESGKPAIVPGNADASRLIEAVRYQNEEFQMPPPKAGKLKESQIADLVAWVNMGAPDPRTNPIVAATPLASRVNGAFVPSAR